MTQRILVTGASKGIGRAIATRLASGSTHITVHYNSDLDGAEETLAAVVAAGGSGRVLGFDVADRDATAAALTEEIERDGAYYGVVSNAGITRDGAFPAMPPEDWDAVIHTNLDSFYNVIQPCVMPMVRAKAGGRIVAISSVSGVLGNRGQVNYSAAKAGIIGATKALALELAKRRITVNCVAPGLIDTGMVGEEVREHALPMIPARRLGEPEEIAGLVAYLMSDIAGYITRQVISIDGGMS